MFSFGTVNFIFVVFVILYLPRIWCWFAPFKKQKRVFNYKKNKLALIIPARNEGNAVLPLFESIENQTYDRNNFDVFVVGDDWTGKYDYLKEMGVTVVYFPYGKGVSSSGLKQRIYDNYQKLTEKSDNHFSDYQIGKGEYQF